MAGEGSSFGAGGWVFSSSPRNKRRLGMDTQSEHRDRPTGRRVGTVTAHKAKHLYWHKDIAKSLQYTDSTTGQASLHGGGDGNYTD